MTANKRFHSERNCIGYYTEIIDEQKKLDLTIPNPKKNLLVEELVDLLNVFYEENEQFREALKELKEIGDYQSFAIQELDNMNRLIEDEIDKKITLLIDAKIQCFQNEDEELLGKINFGIQILNELKEVIE